MFFEHYLVFKSSELINKTLLTTFSQQGWTSYLALWPWSWIGSNSIWLCIIHWPPSTKKFRWNLSKNYWWTNGSKDGHWDWLCKVDSE